jgi:hypothetical protein
MNWARNRPSGQLRYAVEPLQKRIGGGILDYYMQRSAGLAVVIADPSKSAKQPQESPHRFLGDRPEAGFTSIAPTVAQVIAAQARRRWLTAVASTGSHYLSNRFLFGQVAPEPRQRLCSHWHGRVVNICVLDGYH